MIFFQESTEQNFKIGTLIDVEIETPLFSFVKRRSDGSIDFISPLPSAFDYGFVPGSLAADGDPQDAIVFTHKNCRRFDRIRAKIVGRVRFLDAGLIDDKLLAVDVASKDENSSRMLTKFQVFRVHAFFQLYGFLKKILNVYRRKSGATRFLGVNLENDDQK